MRDFAFYNAGCENPKGARRVLVLIRRGLRRILRPIFARQEDIYRDLQTQIDTLARRQEQLADQLSASAAFGWDHVAFARRLAALEDHLESWSELPERQKNNISNCIRVDGPSKHEPASRDYRPAHIASEGPSSSAPLRESQ